jgi:hypothetical protein
MKGIDILKIGILATLGFLAPMLLIGGKETLKPLSDYLPDFSSPSAKNESLAPEVENPTSTSQEKVFRKDEPLEVPEPPVVEPIDPETPREVEFSESPVMPLPTVLRFDITPAWVVDQWPRVSAAMPEMKLQGYRVPLITGTEMNDLAGALTYYFDARKLQRITFRGTTGDFRKLSGWLEAHYGFVLRPTESAGVIVYEKPDPDGGRSESFVWIRPSRLFTEDEPRRRFDVTLVLTRPEE